MLTIVFLIELRLNFRIVFLESRCRPSNPPRQHSADDLGIESRHEHCINFRSLFYFRGISFCFLWWEFCQRASFWQPSVTCRTRTNRFRLSIDCGLISCRGKVLLHLMTLCDFQLFWRLKGSSSSTVSSFFDEIKLIFIKTCFHFRLNWFNHAPGRNKTVWLFKHRPGLQFVRSQMTLEQWSWKRKGEERR